MNILVTLFALSFLFFSNILAQNCAVSNRQDCGYLGIQQQECQSKGCCWVPDNSSNLPWCFYPVSPTPPTPPTQPSPPAPPAPSNRAAFVHLFEWRWTDVALECERFLGPNGYDAVQVSPAMEHIQGPAWWTRYQPVSYNLVSRSGNEQQFRDMVTRCQKVGVKIYADAVFNHCASGSGTGINGSSFGNRKYPMYSQNDFHHNQNDLGSNCGVSNYNDKYNVQHCDLDGLPDLDTSSSYVQQTIVNYLNHFKSIGVSGFRVDAAKHMDDNELGAIVGKVGIFNFCEVLYGAGEPITPEMYTHVGSVTEFRYFRDVGPIFKNNGNLGDLQSLGSNWGLLDSSKAVVFTDNHDTQRGEAPLTYKDGAIYQLFNIFMLAHPYGYPKVMSSYYFSSHDQGPPSVPVYDGNTLRCHDGQNWVCEHRWPAIAGMVRFRGACNNYQLTNWKTSSNNRISFSRGNQCFVAINQDSGNWQITLYTGLPSGKYCDLWSSNCQNVITVDGNGNANLNIPPVGATAFTVYYTPNTTKADAYISINP